MGLSPQTLTRAVRPLIEDGILSERAIHNGRPGQPVRELAYREGRLAVLGLVLTQERISVTAEDLAGTQYFRKQVTGAVGTPARALPIASDLIAECRSALPGHSDLLGLGVAAQGFFLERGRRIVARGDPAGWLEVDLQARLRAMADLPIALQNDARAIAAGLVRMPVGRTYSHYFCLFLSTGVGGALVVDGQIHDGPHGNAGEIGALLPESRARPTISNFLAASELGAIEEWAGFEALPGERRTRLEAWCAEAGAQLSAPLQAVLALLDVEAVAVFSQIPREVVERICRGIRLLPIGADFAGIPKTVLNQPEFVVYDDTSLERGACAVARSHFFSGD